MDLKNFTTDALKAEVKRREERETVLKELTWKTTLNIGEKAANSWNLQQCADKANQLGYKYFVIDTYPHVYRVKNEQFFGYEEIKTVSVLDVK